MDVRRPPPAAGARHGIGARLDRAQLDEPALAGDQARGAVEIRILGRVVGIVGMDVLARGIAVPDFDHRAGDWSAVFVHHARTHVDELAERALLPLPRQVAAQQRQPLLDAPRPGELGARERPAQERLRGPALRGLRVARHHAVGLRLGVASHQHVDTVNRAS